MKTITREIAVILGVMPAKAEWFVREVNRYFYATISGLNIYIAIKSLPINERQPWRVANRLKEMGMDKQPIQKRRPNIIPQPEQPVKPIAAQEPQLPVVSLAVLSDPHNRVSITPVVGVTFDGRQGVVAKLENDEPILLTREPDNPYDRNAIKVVRLNGEQIGYINRHLAAILASKLDTCGGVIPGRVRDIYRGKYSMGVSIMFLEPVDSF